MTDKIAEKIVERGFYLGDRGNQFKMFIQSILNQGDIKQKYIDILLSEKNLENYGKVFTSETIDENNNYQVYEMMGDLTANKFLVSYFFTRFPQLNCSEGVKVVARLKINYSSKQTFADIAEKLGFWPFISSSLSCRNKMKKSLLEDCLEAFFGATESILDSEVTPGIGYIACSKILKNIFDGIPISLQYEDLYDAKTRLKEVVDMFSDTIGKIEYESIKNNNETNVTTNVYRIIDNKKTRFGTGVSSSKATSEQISANEAINKLRNIGFDKKPPNVYKKFNDNEQKKRDIEKEIFNVCGSKDKINSQFYTRGKPRSQNEYTSTVLGFFCKKRDLEAISACIKHGANPNEKDIEGLYCADLLFIGKTDPSVVKEILLKFGRVKMSQRVYEVYFSKYLPEMEAFKKDITVV